MPDNSSNRKVSKDLELLKQQMNDLYVNTYYTSDNSEEFKSQINDKLDDAIRNSTKDDGEYQNIANTTKLFKKLMKNGANLPGQKLAKSFGTGSDNDISSLFQTNELVSSLMDNFASTKWITELDTEYDLICKYMTKLQTALDLKRDTVLCADSFTKEFITVKAKGENPLSDTSIAVQNNISDMVKRYKLNEAVESWYENTSKYGEEFVYCVPYSVALDYLLKRKSGTNHAIVTESTILESEVVKEAKAAGFNIDYKESNTPALKVKFDHSKIIEDVVKESYYVQKNSTNYDVKGISESFVVNETNHKFEDYLKKDGKNTVVKFDDTIGTELEWEDDKSAADGLVSGEDPKKHAKLKVNGALVKVLPHDKIIPIYIEDTLFGVYYFRFDALETDDLNATAGNMRASSITGMFSNNSSAYQAAKDVDSHNQKNILLKTLAGQLSKKIDAEFINANIDLKKEIYQILKFNDSYNQTSNSIEMNVMFISSDDIHHLKFKEDPKTHRGISDLYDSLVPAKQWITINLTSILGWTTRGFDRRIYYVKQSLDTNTAQSLLNVITTIKKGNFGVRQMESVNNILNIVGRFNDFVIPQGPSGDAPIIFDTQPGQQFEFPQELQATNEEAAVNATGVPLEIVNSSTGMDFAIRYTMNNAKLLRNVLKRQLKIEDFCSALFSKIYKFEYDDNVELELILPPPSFLSMTQGTQLFNTAVQYADAITEVEMANEMDDAKLAFKKRIIRKYIPSYISDEEIANIKNEVIIDTNIDKSRAEDEM